MQAISLVVVSVVASTAAAVAVTHLVPPQARSVAGEDLEGVDLTGPLLARCETLNQRIDELQQQLERQDGGRRTAGLTPADVGAAVMAWLDKNGKNPDVAGKIAVATAKKKAQPDQGIDVDKAFAAMAKLSWDEQTEVWAKATPEQRKALLARYEQLAKDKPFDADAQCELGQAYVQVLINGNVGFMEMAKLGTAADKQFTKALEIDDHHWDARFNKAMGLANQPAFLGRGPEAVKHFTTLIEQQEKRAPEAKFEQSYLFLGNLHAQQGRAAEARKVWERGLARFPNSAELEKRLKK